MSAAILEIQFPAHTGPARYVLTVTTILIALFSATVAAAPAQTGSAGSPAGSSEPGAHPDEGQPRAGVSVGESSRMTFYGMLRLDVIVDDSRPNALQTPLFIQPELPDSDEPGSSFTLHPRLSRFGTDLAGSRVTLLGKPEITGKLEFDFQNGGRESRAIPRFRHAYLKLAWPRVELLAGQTWDIISPLLPAANADTLMWNAGNLGDRRPQVRLTYRGGTAPRRAPMVLTVGAGLTGAVDGQDLDGDGVLDGEASGVPNLQVRVAVGASPAPRGRGVLVGLWGHVGRMAATMQTSGVTRRTWTSSSIGVDYDLAIAPRLTVRGELWAGESLGDVRGGIGQSIEPLTGDPIRSRGGWSEIAVQVTPAYSSSAGYTVDDPEPGALRADNGAWYFVNQYRSGRSLTLGADYMYWRTRYRPQVRGDDHRLNVYIVFAF
jgi:hypothetical protein